MPPFRETRDYVRKVIERYQAEGGVAVRQKPDAKPRGATKQKAAGNQAPGEVPATGGGGAVAASRN